MSRKKSNFLIFNTQQILESVLCEGIQERHNEAFLHAFCSECDSSDEGVRKIILKLQRYETSRLMINAVIKSLDEEKQLFIQYLYKDKKTPDWVADTMYLSKAQTNLWNNKILREMTEAMRFRLYGDDDIFNLKKIINMREAMADLLLLIRKTDRQLKIVDNYWYLSLLTRYNNFSALIDFNNTLFQAEKKTAYISIVTYKLEHPNADLQEMATVFGCHRTSIGRNLSKYLAEINKFMI